jgi:hypothetical protein
MKNKKFDANIIDKILKFDQKKIKTYFQHEFDDF